MLIKTKYIYATLWFMGCLLIQSCSIEKQIVKELSNPKLHPYFSGLMVFDPASGKTLISYHSDLYFTPASTVKLFTLYTAKHYLSDSIATLSYYESKDTIYIKPLADPSFLHDSLPNSTYEFLSTQIKPIAIVEEPFSDFVFGDGWQWDDYQFYYMPEKSLFPIYGNFALLNGKQIIPNYFQKNTFPTNSIDYHRDFFKNQFYYNPENFDSNRKIPFKTSLELSAHLLSDTIHKPIYFSHLAFEDVFKLKKSTPTRPLYSRLMNESENFMAEQLLLIIAKNTTNQYKVSNSIQLALDSLFRDIPQKPRWVDASGLSRYNLFTPHDMVYILDKMQKEWGPENAMQLMPHNGKTGTLHKWYPSEFTYIFAKTGSVSNNHNLSGYLITKKGTFLIFSYMNNNFMEKSSEVRSKMNEVLLRIYNTY